MKNQKGFTRNELLMCGSGIALISIFFGVVYTVFHFASKFWQ